MNLRECITNSAVTYVFGNLIEYIIFRGGAIVGQHLGRAGARTAGQS